MTSEPIRDPLTDHLLTPQNCTLVVIDYQPNQIQVVTSMDRDLLVRNIVSVARTARTYGVPIVLSTVGVANGSKPTIPELKEVLADNIEIDRTSINAWGGRRVPPGGRSHRTQEADHDGAVDRSLPRLPVARRVSSGLRDLSGG